MSFEAVLTLTNMAFGWAFVLQSVEHLRQADHNRLFHAARLVLSLCLLASVAPAWVALALTAGALWSLFTFDGPYNGGSDRMGYLILFCLTCAHWAPAPLLAELAMGYLAVQLVLSYLLSGWVKVINPDWRSGQALRDVFAFSVYPVSQAARGWSAYPGTLTVASRAVIAIELLFPLSLLHPFTLLLALTVTAAFHLGNAVFLGLNRFFWVWIAAFPSLIWFQARFLL